MFRTIFDAAMDLARFIRDSVRERNARREREEVQKTKAARDAASAREAGWIKERSMRNADLGQRHR